MKSSLPTTLIIFGATGDLTRRKLIPALYSLYSKQLLPGRVQVIGFSRRDITDDQFRTMMRDALNQFSSGAIEPDNLESFLSTLHYHQGYFDKPQGYQSLAKDMGFDNGQWTSCTHRIFYLATPPEHYPDIINHLSDSGLADPCSDEEGINQILIEKPFGSNTQTAEQLDALLGRKFHEDQIYRIDHYLAKEALQNILTFRFSNSIFEPSWNRDYIESVHIRMHEDIDIQGRGAFYDHIGALRDVGQNHLLQMLAIIAMENPSSMDANTIRKQRAQVLKTLINIDPADIDKQTLRAQYQGYTQEPGIDQDSQTETYFKLTCYLDHPRWADVPFILEAGKNLPEKLVDITITFKHPEKCICPPGAEHDFRNQLTFRIQPGESIQILFWAKHPGLTFNFDAKQLEFSYANAFADYQLPDAYEKIFLDALHQDQTLFTQTEELLATWDFITGIVQAWAQDLTPLHTYQPGTIPEVTHTPK